jgi:hypothetical protein
MPHEPQPPLVQDQVRHELNMPLTVIHRQTEQLQRQLRRRNGLSDDDRRWLEAGMGSILTAARVMGAAIDRRPPTTRTQCRAIRDDTDSPSRAARRLDFRRRPGPSHCPTSGRRACCRAPR